MDNVAVLKTANDVHDRIHFADIAQKLVAKAFALRSTFYQTCDVYKLDHSRRYLFGMIQISQKL